MIIEIGSVFQAGTIMQRIKQLVTVGVTTAFISIATLLLRPAIGQTTPATLPSVPATNPSDFPGLHNVVAFADGLYSGSVPEGEAGFDSLMSLGIRTIITVDGAQPDVDKAAVRGMRYVHLPIGYNGMDKTRTLEIARAIKELPHPIYLHCHHGKHRSAGALGAAAVTLGLLTTPQATAKMKISGTAPNYTGLYQCVNVAALANADELAAASNEFPQRSMTSGMVDTMVEIDDVFEHLKSIEKAGWNVPADHPDLVPAAEAGRLADLLRNLRDDEHTQARPAEFASALLIASKEVETVEEGLQSGAAPALLSAKFKIVANTCRQCHVNYRD